MKKILLKVLAVVAVIALICVIVAATTGPKLTPVTDSAMKVNGQDVPTGVFNYYISSTKEYLSGYGVDFNSDTGKQYMAYIEDQAVEMLKEIAAVRGAALDKGLKFDETQVDTLLQQEKSSFEDDAAYQKWLKDNGMTENDVLWLLESQLLGEAYYNDVIKDVKVTEADAKKAFDEDPDKYITKQFSHIFLAVDADATAAEKAAIKQKAVGLIKQLDSGADFKALAAKYNTDSTKDTGGSLSQTVTRDTSTYVDEFNKAAFALTKVGEYTKTPVETSFGYHIIKLDAMTDKFDDLKESIISDMKKTQEDDTYSATLDALMADLKIDKEYAKKYSTTTDSTTTNGTTTKDTTNTAKPSTEDATSTTE